MAKKILLSEIRQLEFRAANDLDITVEQAARLRQKATALRQKFGIK